MKKTTVFLALCFCTSLVFAQESKNPVTTAIQQLQSRMSKNLIGSAEEMPADKYSYKPTADQMTFGHLMMHIAQSNVFMCGKISGTTGPDMRSLKDTDSKDKLVAGIKQSFDYCQTALGKVDDSKLSQSVTLFGGRPGTVGSAILGLAEDWGDHYSAAATYLRLNGKLPPTAQHHRM